LIIYVILFEHLLSYKGKSQTNKKIRSSQTSN
jgi:hypothetical protein